MNKEVQKSFELLKTYCEAEDFKGYDPYDGLNSRFFQTLPGLSSNRILRLAWIQFFKRFPLNFRTLAGIKKEYNPKALGLFLSGYCQLYQQENKQEYFDKIHLLTNRIREMKSVGWNGSCWGYNFDWQARAFFQPKGTPTVVASAFIANALLDAYQITGEKLLLNEARSTCDFILSNLNRTYDSNGNFAFSYSPLDKSVVFNASLLGSSLLARVFSHTEEKLLYDEGIRSVEYCCSYQQNDGSWCYGLAPFHQWIDNFHTGYNLECLSNFMKYTQTDNFQVQLEKGFNFYIKNFFTEEGISKYYHNRTFPIDIHCPAQLVITLSKLNKLSENIALLDKVLLWTIRNMQTSNGYFYYQINKYFSSRIPYMRWAQAWMFYAFATYIKFESDEKN